MLFFIIRPSRLAICIYFFILTLFYSPVINAQKITRLDGSDISVSQLTKEIQDLTTKGKVHGLTISIVSKDSLLYQNAFGYKDINQATNLNVNHGFYAASFSKSVFAYIVMKLVDQGQIDLDEPLETYLDKPLTEYEFKETYEGYQNLKNDPRYKKITARMCLSHTSGLPNWRYIGKFGINMEKELEIEFDPGTYYSYSGEGIYLLHFIVEQITGKDLEELAQEFVFKPMDMKMTSFVWHDRFEDNRAKGHYKKKKTVPLRKRRQSNAAGSMETTPVDFALFIQSMLSRKGLSAEAFNDMISSQIKITSKQQFGSNRMVETDANKNIDLSYGLGWGIYKTPYGKAVFKEGHLRGWEHYCLFYPDNNLGIVIMTNSANGESIFKPLLKVALGDKWMPWYWEGFYPYNL